MKKSLLWEEENQLVRERYDLSMERITQIGEEHLVETKYQEYFNRTAKFILMIGSFVKELESGKMEHADLVTLEQWNTRFYEDILEEQYSKSYANPGYAVKQLGKEYGQLMSFLYTEIRGMIVYAHEYHLENITKYCELFIQVYNAFEEEENPLVEEIHQIIYWFISDYSDQDIAKRLRELMDPSLTFAVDIVMDSDLTDLRYLYQYGEYITEYEKKMASYMNQLSEETIEKIASAYTEGYRIGFEITGKDISKKKAVQVRYVLGFERMVRQAIKNFRKMGLEPVITRSSVQVICGRGRGGYYGAIPNKQFDYDHLQDLGLFLDSLLVNRRCEVEKAGYESLGDLPEYMGGPAVIETFGEEPFSPLSKEENVSFSQKQQGLKVEMDSHLGRIRNEYIHGDERSYTIIAFPTPHIGKQFEEIFEEIIRINTLDYQKYRRIQQILVDQLDLGESVRVLGKNGNQTDITVSLISLKDPKKETKFENCVADVNIPVGEVFTSPKLHGTSGILHVSSVFLNNLHYKDLKLTFKDGMVDSYTCKNFATEEENKQYIKENLLYHRETLPMGEFAIGTNTVAYQVANKFQIAGKLPILIAEKMGPHFAVGDTCYSWEEDVRAYNPDGKEIVARDNEISITRKKDVGGAYFNCHTDITIPYDELGSIHVIKGDGSEISLIENGRFVLAGTEELNEPLDE